MEIEKKTERMQNFRNAYFRLTRKCNNNCPHCYVNLPMEVKIKEFSVNNWCNIIDQLVKENFHYLTLTGGEPTLYPGFKEVYLYAKKQGMIITLMTNSTNLDEETKNILYNYPPQRIITTVYGVDEETYFQVTRNKEGWKNFSKNINFFLKLKKEKGTILTMDSILTKDTIKFYPAISELVESYTGQGTQYTPFLFLRQDGNLEKNNIIKSKRLDKEEQKEVMRRMKKWEKNSFPIKTFEEDEINNKLFPCNIESGNNIYFFEDGTMTLCSLIGQEEYTIKLKQEELENFDYKKAKERLYEKFSPLLKLELNEKCTSCRLRKRCFVCPALNLLEGIPANSYIEELCLK